MGEHVWRPYARHEEIRLYVILGFVLGFINYDF